MSADAPQRTFHTHTGSGALRTVVLVRASKAEMAGTPGSLEHAYLVATGAEADHVAGQ